VIVKKLKETVAGAKRNRQEVAELYQQLLGDDYRRMQVETLRWLVELWGNDPEDFQVMYEEHQDQDGVVIPDVEVIAGHHPELINPINFGPVIDIARRIYGPRGIAHNAYGFMGGGKVK
jgi:hypothetical protein